MKRFFPSRAFAFFLLSFFLSLLNPQIPSLIAQEAEKKQELSLEDIAKTEAAKLFIAKQYRKSLTAFEALETEHPQSVIIKRYIASLYDTLGERQKAVKKLEQALEINPEDMIARQMLGDVSIKIADFKRATEQFQYIKDKNPTGPLGQYAAAKLNSIQSIEVTTPKTVEGEKMSVQDFMNSAPAQTFAKGKYEDAAKGFEEMLLRYPQDVLAARFYGMSLMRLKRNKEAAEVFEKALKADPGNAALHFYLGQAYAALDKMEEARKEYRWVVENQKGPYQIKAQQAMFQTLRKGPAPAQKPWSLSGNFAYDFDTNATFKSEDRAYATAGDKNSSKYASSLSGTYRLFQKKRWTVSTDALVSESILQDFPNLNTYSTGGGISGLYGFNLWGKSAFLSVRYSPSMTFLKNKFYLLSNSISPSLIYTPHPNFRTNLSYRFVINEYDNDGLTPHTTSRDGFQNVFAISNTHYLNAAKTFYWTHGYDYERHDTSGDNNIKNVNIGRLGLHKTLIEKIEGDISFVFKDSDYKVFKSTPPKRRDDLFTLIFTLSRPLAYGMTLSGSYTFEDSRAKNNAYEYRRHDFGVKLAFRY